MSADKAQANRGRKALPEDQRQSKTIRERVTPGKFDLYQALGGKDFLMEVLREREQYFRPDAQIMADFCFKTPNGMVLNWVKFDITAFVMALGREKACSLYDMSRDIQNLKHSAYAPADVQQWQGRYEIRARDAIQRYFRAFDVLVVG